MKSSISKIKKQVQRGFTLVEIAIVLVIIGLMIGGVLRGQELINSGRVRSLITQQSGMQTAYYAFLDRYKFMPGNMSTAQAALIGNTAIGLTTSSNNSIVNPTESPVVFNNLATAGFINCTSCINLTTGPTSTTQVAPSAGWSVTSSATSTANIFAGNSPINTFGNPLIFFANPAMVGGVSAGISFVGAATEAGKPTIVTGSGVPTSLLAEMDRKQDDGNPGTGIFRYSDLYVGTGGTIATCTADTNSLPIAKWNVAPISQCQGANLL